MGKPKGETGEETAAERRNSDSGYSRRNRLSDYDFRATGKR
jgi:hypothetical protein